MKKKIFAISLSLAGLTLVVFFADQTPGHLIPETAKRYHYSLYSQKDFFEDAFSAAQAFPSRSAGRIVGLLFNHHLLAPHFIAQVLEATASGEPLAVILISPNHFGAGNGPVLTSNESWQTPYGELEPDSGVIDTLVASGLVKMEEPPFENEHGIRNVVAFIKRELPNAKVVPLIIKDNLPSRDADALAATLSELPGEVLLAGSFDFSHYQDLETANRHDEKSLAIVQSLNWQGTAGLDVDSPIGLRIFLETLARLGASRFSLLQHSNSAIVADERNASSTTSYITGIFSSD
ncbi:MAG: AmmeMemoRadiSam system protein B [Patescibacteria group bacterium]|nr:AmmeMemoRadiSam system protein B [Patescibacteria group bacterium]